jgi:hypothetical protein
LDELNKLFSEGLAEKDASATESEESVQTGIDSFGFPIWRHPKRAPRPQPEHNGEPDYRDWAVSPPLENKYGQQLQNSGALPVCKYPEPGKAITPEINALASAEGSLYLAANQELTYTLFALRMKQTSPSYFDEQIQESVERRLQFLRAVWSGKGVRIPSDEELLAMAQKPRGKEWIDAQAKN